MPLTLQDVLPPSRIIPRGKGKQVVAKASFTREEKKSLLKYCWQPCLRCVSPSRGARSRKSTGARLRGCQKKAERAAAGEQTVLVLRTMTVWPQLVPILLADWRFDDDDDASSMPPLV